MPTNGLTMDMLNQNLDRAQRHVTKGYMIQ
jgi:hypothetical protein